ncbi:MAG TPA: DNA mismatch repair protein MutS [Candidatus Hydrothermia bacterium]|nr:DNA mismatch repair protein MutS [Candidatus Hydrothermia bacterium]
MAETPLLSQYKSLKEKNVDTLLAFRIGDFYEFLYDDAQIASRILGITLTSKPLYKNHRAPLAGIPAKAAWQYFEKLIRNGFKVAICEQTGEGKKLMEREIVEVLTPGTFYHPDFSDEKEHVFISSISEMDDKACIAIADIGTGEVFIERGNMEGCLNRLEVYGVREVLTEEDTFYNLKGETDLPLAKVPAPLLNQSSMISKLMEFFNAPDLKVININEDPLEIRAVFNLIAYLEDKKPGMLTHLRTVRRVESEKSLIIDSKTAEHLELVEKPFGNDGDTLLHHLRETITPQGVRYLKENLLTPKKDFNEINKRLLKVEFLLDNPELALKVRNELRRIADLERIITRLSTQKFHIRDFLRLSESLDAIQKIRDTLNDISIFEPPEIYEELVAVKSYIENSIERDPPAEPPGWTKKGVNPELDELKFLLFHSKEKMLEMERKEKEKTGINNLRIGFNQVFGYYFEVTKSQLDKVPSYFIRKQTLQGAERFYTNELKDLEEKLISAEEKIKSLEREIVEELRTKTISLGAELCALSAFIKELDLVQCFAEISKRYKYTKPIIHEGKKIIIKEGRHPVVERTLKNEFVPNDTCLDADETLMYIITGPNMSGKSTYLRQVAIIVLMAHMGCFVPASYAEIPLTDRIFTRIGASDDVTRGVSTFMAEMLETSEIVRNATENSLLILDEIGRGTSTTDGIAIAWACAEYIITKLKAKTLFATHYHELSELSRIYTQIKNYHMKVTEWEGNVIFMRKLTEGVANKSYGIHVASLSGIPAEIIKRATEIASQIESKENEMTKKIRKNLNQLSFFEETKEGVPCEVCSFLKTLNVDGISPREALNLLYKLKGDANRCSNS